MAILTNMELISPSENEETWVAGHNKLCHMNQSTEKERRTDKNLQKNEGIVGEALYLS